ncbi:hypothetical protein ACM26W_16495 [Halomonas sp. HK25]|uniref:hypothetical protein n=1 Tax=Halomonas sp. HK25 TaxID=3394321 RepID=UPI0039FCCC22
MGVKGFAWGVMGLGMVLGLFGWWAWNPVAFVGLALAIVGAVILATRRRGPGTGA